MFKLYTYYSASLIQISLSSPRCPEALRLFTPGSSQRSPIVDMIEFLPETYKVATGTENSMCSTSIILQLYVLIAVTSTVAMFFCFHQQHLLDSCVRESDDDHNSPNYHVIQLQVALSEHHHMFCIV